MKLYPEEYTINIEEFKKKFKLGDTVTVPASLASLTHEAETPQTAEIVGLYPHFFNVKYAEGWEQSIQYRDAGIVARR